MSQKEIKIGAISTISIVLILGTIVLPNILSSSGPESYKEGLVTCGGFTVFDATANKVIISINEPFVKGKWILMEEYLPDLILDFEPSPEWLAIEKQLHDYFANKSKGEKSSSSTPTWVFDKEFVSGLSSNTWYDR